MGTGRRAFMEAVAAVSAVGGGPAGSDDGTGTTEPKTAADVRLDVEARSLAWVRNRLREHYGDGQYWEPPHRGYYHLYADERFRLPADRDAALTYATVAHSLWSERYGADRYDCEDFAFRLRTFFARLTPTANVGVVVDQGARHAYNLFLLADGTAFEWEPRTAEDVTSSDDERYRPTHGVLFF